MKRTNTISINGTVKGADSVTLAELLWYMGRRGLLCAPAFTWDRYAGFSLIDAMDYNKYEHSVSVPWWFFYYSTELPGHGVTGIMLLVANTHFD